MPRPIRHHVPGTYYFVTSRCFQARFLLRPDGRLKQLLLVWLARAQRHRPGVRLHGFVNMSNHLHLIVCDTDGSLAEWAKYFFGNLAKAINRARGRTGTVWSRRYSAEPILDDDALVERAVYAITNPVQAGLCSTHTQWPGALEFATNGEPKRIPVSWIDAAEFEAACRSAAAEGLPRPPLEAGRVHGEVTIHPLAGPEGEAEVAARLRDAVAAREAELREERIRLGRGVATPEAVLAQHWDAAPASPKQSERPLCHTTRRQLRDDYRALYRSFLDAFREAAQRWRKGIFDCVFPDWCYRPGGGLVRHPPPATT